MRTASSVGKKYVERASNASDDYLKGAEATSKDQSVLAIEAIPRMKSALIKAIDTGRVAKGLQAAGKTGWLNGIRNKGHDRFSGGVSAALPKYVTNSGRFDAARGAADSLPRGEKGSETNNARVKAVVAALRREKVGAAA